MAVHHMKAAVVDSNQDSLLSLQKVLEECNYIVTQCENSEQFLSTIKEDETKFDLVIIEVSVTPIDGYELCRLVHAEHSQIPIIVTSSSSCSSSEMAEMVKKALDHGASDFLLNPIKVEDLMKIKPKGMLKRLAKQESSLWDEELDISATNKAEQLAVTEQPARKRQRFVWTEEAHDAFVKAVDKLGEEKAVPKKIMEEMNIAGIGIGITRENVASHLQKFRKKKQQEKKPQQQQQPQKQQQQPQQQQQQPQQQQQKHIVEQDANHALIPHQRETDYPIIGQEFHAAGFDWRQQQPLPNLNPNPNPTHMIYDPNHNPNPAHLVYDPNHNPDPSHLAYDLNPNNPAHLFYDPNPNPTHLSYDPNPSFEQLVYAQNTHYIDQVLYFDSSNIEHELGISDYIPGLPITPRIEIKYGNLKTCSGDHSLTSSCPLYHDQYQPPPGISYDHIQHNLSFNPVADQNDQINTSSGNHRRY